MVQASSENDLTFILIHNEAHCWKASSSFCLYISSYLNILYRGLLKERQGLKHADKLAFRMKGDERNGLKK